MKNEIVNEKLFNNQENIMFPKENECFHCGSKDRSFSLRLIHTNRPDLKYYPEYIPQVKECCAKCGKHIRFSPQTDQLITRFNEELSNLIIKEVK